MAMPAAITRTDVTAPFGAPTAAQRWYLWGLIAVFVPIAAAVWLPALLLWRTGEIWPESLAVRHQARHDAIWSSGLIQNEYAFKRAMFDRHQPDIVAIGSSRVLQLREEMFAGRFLNMGRGLDEVLHFRETLDQLTAERRPRLMLWALDHWILADSFRRSGLRHERATQLASINTLPGRVFPEILPSQIFATWDLLRVGHIRGGKISLRDAAAAILWGASLPGPRLGLRAALTDFGGYGQDGSFYYFTSYQRPTSRYHEMLLDARKNRELSDVGGISRTQEVISDEAVAEIAATLRMLRARGIAVALFLPPLPSDMAAVITRDRPDLTRLFQDADMRLRAAAAETGAVFHDYLTDPGPIDLTDGEFLDAGHPGEPAMAKILLHLGGLSGAVAQATDQNAVRRIAEQYRGLAVVDRPSFYERFGVRREEPWPPKAPAAR